MNDISNNSPAVYISRFDDIHGGESTNNVRNPKLTRKEKRAIIKHQLQNNLPAKNVVFFGIIFILIGLTAIGLQIALIVYKSAGFHIGNGIWGGGFAILNGLIKLNIC